MRLGWCVEVYAAVAAAVLAVAVGVVGHDDAIGSENEVVAAGVGDCLAARGSGDGFDAGGHWLVSKKAVAFRCWRYDPGPEIHQGRHCHHFRRCHCFLSTGQPHP